MRRPGAGARRGEDGSAVVEFVLFGVLLLLPVLYLVVALSRLHAGAYAVATAAREAGRTFVTAPTEAQAPGRAQAAAALALADQGFRGRGTTRVSCTGTPCLARQGSVSVRTELAVDLPFVPRMVADVVPASITISATHTESVDRFGDDR